MGAGQREAEGWPRGNGGPASMLLCSICSGCDGCSHHIGSSAAIRPQYVKLERGPAASSLQIRLKGEMTSLLLFCGLPLLSRPLLRSYPQGARVIPLPFSRDL